MTRRRYNQYRPPAIVQVDTVAEAHTLSGLGDGQLVAVKGVGVFAWFAGKRFLAPPELHPLYGDYTLVGFLRASDLAPANPDSVVDGDLPTGWSVAKAGGGEVKLVNGEIQLISGAGDTGLAELTYGGLSVPASGDDFVALLALHTWKDDGNLVDSSANNANFCLEFQVDDTQSQWTDSSAGGYSANLNSGNILAGSTIHPNQPKEESWELFEFQWDSQNAYCCGVRRLDGGAGATLGPLQWPRRRGSWTNNVEADRITYRAANGVAADPDDVILHVRFVAVFQQGVS